MIYAAYPISVTITGNPDPQNYTEFEPGTSVRFECIPQQGFEPHYFQWSSTCTGSYFVLQTPKDNVVEKTILHAADSGSHTCTVTDDVGNTGNATVVVTVTGKFEFSSSKYALNANLFIFFM